jgi:hypothetical protein
MSRAVAENTPGNGPAAEAPPRLAYTAAPDLAAAHTPLVPHARAAPASRMCAHPLGPKAAPYLARVRGPAAITQIQLTRLLKSAIQQLPAPAARPFGARRGPPGVTRRPPGPHRAGPPRPGALTGLPARRGPGPDRAGVIGSRHAHGGRGRINLREPMRRPHGDVTQPHGLGNAQGPGPLLHPH